MQGYKDSGIEWIGDIPGKWRINKIKYIANLYGRIGWQGLTSDEYVNEGPYLITGVDFSNGKIDWNNCVHISEYRWEQADKIKIKNGDLLITKDGTVGKVAIVNNLTGKASLNSGVLLINLNSENNKKFLFWVLCSEVFWTWFNYKNSGNSTILHLYQKDFNEFNYCMPSVQEQQQIADFLEEECERIDRITEKIEKQIEILKEYKKSLITETVTRGLNKNVKMKDSGVDIIGCINDIYQIRRLRYICSIDTGNHDTQDGIDDGIYDFFVRSPIVEKINEYDFEGEAILMAGDGVGAGKVFHHAIGKFGVHQRVYIVYNFKGIIPRFLYYFMSNFFSIEMEKGSAKSTVDSIRMPMLKNFSIVLPSLREQQQIADFLDKRCSEIDLILSKKANQLDIIKEHKKSLIYEYVTGKKRVGGIENGD